MMDGFINQIIKILIIIIIMDSLTIQTINNCTPTRQFGYYVYGRCLFFRFSRLTWMVVMDVSHVKYHLNWSVFIFA